METVYFQQAFTAALRAGDEQLARCIVDEACAANVSVESIYYRIFAPSMARIGDLWEQRALDVASEHLATVITERQIERLSWQVGTPDRQQAVGTVVLGCIVGEYHTLGLRMVADVFRLYGWHVLELGPNVPSADWINLVVRRNAHAVGISAQARRHLPAVAALLGGLHKAVPGLPVAVGGALFDRDPLALVAQLTARRAHEAEQTETAE
jgi:MerR family transcriptional regulator, light-induced transcriptional regulator